MPHKPVAGLWASCAPPARHSDRQPLGSASVAGLPRRLSQSAADLLPKCEFLVDAAAPSITEAVSVTQRTASYQACQAHEEHAGSRPRGAALALRNAPDRSGHMTRVRLRPFTAIRRGRFACFRSRPSPTPHARTIRPRARGCASSPVSLSRPPRGATEVGEALRRAHGGGASAADGDRLR